jgi:hypothetical protein
MNLSVSIYDVFASAVPGSLYLVAGIYLAARFGWVEWARPGEELLVMGSMFGDLTGPGQAGRGANMMTATPRRQMVAPVRS